MKEEKRVFKDLNFERDLTLKTVVNGISYTRDVLCYTSLGIPLIYIRMTD